MIRLHSVKPRQSFDEQMQTLQEFVCLTVQDNGCGMDPATLEHIYDPFFTTKQKGGQRGTGLGLSMVSGIVKRHEGYIEVESEPGGGTVFRVYFPVLQEQEAPSTNELISYAGSGNEHILLIDDEKIVCDLSATLLEQLGYRVTAYTDGHEALNNFKLNAQDYQLVITDYSMSEWTGIQLMKRIKEIRRDIPIVLVTGYSNLNTLENLQKFGCDGIVAKPYDSEALGQAVRQALAQKPASNEQT